MVPSASMPWPAGHSGGDRAGVCPLSLPRRSGAIHPDTDDRRDGGQGHQAEDQDDAHPALEGEPPRSPIPGHSALVASPDRRADMKGPMTLAPAEHLKPCRGGTFRLNHSTEAGATVGPSCLAIGASGGPGLLDHCHSWMRVGDGSMPDARSEIRTWHRSPRIGLEGPAQSASSSPPGPSGQGGVGASGPGIAYAPSIHRPRSINRHRSEQKGKLGRSASVGIANGPGRSGSALDHHAVPLR